MRWRADDLLAVDQTATTKTANTERQLCGTTGNLRSRPQAGDGGRPVSGSQFQREPQKAAGASDLSTAVSKCNATKTLPI